MTRMMMVMILLMGWDGQGWVSIAGGRERQSSQSHWTALPPIQSNKAFSSVGGQTFKPSMEDGLRKHPSSTLILVITTINIVGIKIIVIISVSIMIHDHHDRHNWQWQANP